MDTKHEKVQVVLFDFDGTLVDIQTIFFQILNVLAPLYHFPMVTEAEIPELKKMTAKDIIFRYLKIPWWKFLWLERRARTEYLKRIQEVKLFPGVIELLQALREKGVTVGVVSSSSEEFITTFFQKQGITVDFVRTCSIFGKARALKKLLKERGFSREDVVYIGDEIRDVEACQKANIRVLGAGWGLNDPDMLLQSGAEQVYLSPEELKGALLKEGK